jgi:hypothetical protein
MNKRLIGDIIIWIWIGVMWGIVIYMDIKEYLNNKNTNANNKEL